MDPMFKKVTLLLNGKIKKAYICKCYVADEKGEANYCNIKSNTFKEMVRHLQKHHSIFLPESVICRQHEMIMSTTCSLISHYKQHIEEGMTAFNYQDESEECPTCKTNFSAVKLCRSGMPCVL